MVSVDVDVVVFVVVLNSGGHVGGNVRIVWDSGPRHASAMLQQCKITCLHHRGYISLLLNRRRQARAEQV